MADKSQIQLGLDVQEMDQALDDAEGSFKDFGDKVEATTVEMNSAWGEAINAIAEETKSVFRSAMDYVAAYVYDVFDEIAARVRQGSKDFMEAEQDILRMNQALRATGNVTGFTADQMDQLAKKLSSFTVFSASAFRAAEMALLKFGNVRGDIFVDAIKAAADLAAITGDLTGAADKFGEALHDPIKGLKMLKDAGYVFSQQQLDLIDKMKEANDIIGLQRFILQAAAQVMGGNAKDQAATLGGQIERLNNIMNNMFEKIGSLFVPMMTKYFIPAVDNASKVVAYLVDKLNEGGDMIGDFIKEGIEVAIEYFWKFVDAGTVAFSYVESIIDEFGSFWRGSWEKIQAATATALANAIELLSDWAGKAVEFAKVVWEYMKELWNKVLEGAKIASQGLVNAFQAFYDFMKTMITSMSKNFANFWTGVQVLLKGGTWDFVWDNMKRGFNSGIDDMQKKLAGLGIDKDMPGIKDMVGRLRKFAADHDKDADDLFKDFDDKFADNLKKNQDRVAAFIQTIKDIMSGKDIKPGADNNPFLKTEGDDEDKKRGDEFRSTTEDLASLNKRISAAALSTPETKKLDEQLTVMRAWQRQDDANDKAALGAINAVATAVGAQNLLAKFS